MGQKVSPISLREFINKITDSGGHVLYERNPSEEMTVLQPQTVEYMKEMLVLDTPNDEDAGNYFIEEIRKCKNERLRQLDSFLQNLKL